MRGVPFFALATLLVLVLNRSAVLFDKTVIPVGGTLDFVRGGVIFHQAAHQLKGAKGVVTKASVGAHVGGALSACDAFNLAAVPLVLTTVSHQAKNHIAVVYGLLHDACQGGIKLAVVNARSYTNEWISGEVQLFCVLINRGDVNGLDLGILCHDGVHEFLGVAVVLGTIQNHGLHD